MLFGVYVYFRLFEGAMGGGLGASRPIFDNNRSTVWMLEARQTVAIGVLTAKTADCVQNGRQC